MKLIGNKDRLLEELNKSFIPDSSIAIHGLNFTELKEVPKIITSVFDKGLINKGPGGVVSNCEVLGTTDYYDDNRLINYAYYPRDGAVVNVYVDIPYVIEHKGTKYFIGPFLKHNTFQKYDESINSIWLNQIVDEHRLLPTQFIVGASVYIERLDQTVYYPNPKFLGNLSKEAKERFINNLIEKCKGMRVITIDENNIEKSYQDVINIQSLLKEFRMDDYYARSAKHYIEDRYLNQKTPRNKP